MKHLYSFLFLRKNVPIAFKREISSRLSTDLRSRGIFCLELRLPKFFSLKYDLTEGIFDYNKLVYLHKLNKFTLNIYLKKV
jgi:hypothetical protein